MSLAESRTVDVGESICLDVPLVMPDQAHFAAWPSNDGDSTCTCPLCQGSKDCNLDDCPCYKSSFAPTWSESVELDGSPQLCWPKLSKDRNNSQVYFFTEVIACHSSMSESLFISTSLVNSVKFQVRGTSKLSKVMNTPSSTPNSHLLLNYVLK